MLDDVHLGIKLPINASNAIVIKGHYQYYHYKCDEFDDRGWGCGYRTLQTIISWILQQLSLKEDGIDHMKVPSILEIQKLLVNIGDKSSNFIGSREWIGSIEISYVIESLFKVNSKIIHAKNLQDVVQQTQSIYDHFLNYGSPIMMGGNKDCSSKGVLGICSTSKEKYLLILDPHYCGEATTKEYLQKEGWIKWQNIESLDQSSFYNLCCPLLKAL